MSATTRARYLTQRPEPTSNHQWLQQVGDLRSRPAVNKTRLASSVIPNLGSTQDGMARNATAGGEAFASAFEDEGRSCRATPCTQFQVSDVEAGCNPKE